MAKNVAGYDAHDQAGRHGHACVMTEISLKVFTEKRGNHYDPVTEKWTLRSESHTFNERPAAEPKPLSGALLADGTLYLTTFPGAPPPPPILQLKRPTANNGIYR